MVLNDSELTQSPTNNWYRINVNKSPILTKEEEYDLFKSYGGGDLDAAYKLVMANLRYVSTLVMKYNNNNDQHRYEDLMQEGTIAVMHCIKKFDVDVGVRFISFARIHIERALQDYCIQNMNGLTYGTGHSNRKLFNNMRGIISKQQQQNNRSFVIDADIKAASEELNVNYHTCLSYYDTAMVRHISLEDRIDDESISLIETIPDSGQLVEDIIDDESLPDKKEHILDIIRRMDDRQKTILENRYLCDKKMTLRELAERFNISIERVRQIEKTALSSIKTLMGN
jgi:RNA polymerase sigma-32 factor